MKQAGERLQWRAGLRAALRRPLPAGLVALAGGPAAAAPAAWGGSLRRR